MSISSPPAPISVRVDGSCFVRACPSHLSARAKSIAVLRCGLAAASALVCSAARNASYGGLPLAEITVAAQCRRGSRFLGQIWGGLLHFRLQARVCVIRGIGCTELS